MEIFDDGYLAEEEKAAIDTQDLIYLAISNFTEEPILEIFPRDVYQYTLKEDGSIIRTHYYNPNRQKGKDVLWDCFINARKTSAKFQVLYSTYRKTEYMDDDGNIHPFNENPHTEILQMDFVGRKKPYAGIMPAYKNTAYFLGWVSDDVFLKTLHTFAQKEEQENADFNRRIL